ncbi:RHS repeat-associated core domain-containing protein, partial [Shewanella denitrificans]
IQMGGRIYDPNLARFLQADPNIQAPTNLQNYNRYSYVLNNPLTYTDPSGYFFKGLFRAIADIPILNAVISVVFAVYCQACLVAYNAMSTYSVTGSLKSTFTSGLTTAIMPGGGSAGGVLASAAIGGLSSKLQGGDFGHGFISAGIGAAFGGRIEVGNQYANVIVAAVIGGTISKLTGGKFANGAVTAGFARAVFGGASNQDSAAVASDSQSQLSGITKALGVVGDVMGRIWSLPNTLIGLGYGGIGMMFGATPVWDGSEGILHFTNMPEWMMPSAMSFGHVHVYGQNSYKNPNGSYVVNRFDSPIVTEETLHTRQSEILGPLYLPLHGMAMGVSQLTGGGTHNKNLLEMGPESGKNPWPW